MSRVFLSDVSPTPELETYFPVSLKVGKLKYVFALNTDPQHLTYSTEADGTLTVTRNHPRQGIREFRDALVLPEYKNLPPERARASSPATKGVAIYTRQP